MGAAAQPPAPYDGELRPGLAWVFFDAADFQRPRKVGADAHIDVDTGIRIHDYSRLWHGFLRAPTTGELTIHAEADDGLRLRLGEALVIDGWGAGRPREGRLRVEAGHLLPLRLEFFQLGGRARLRLDWSWADHPRRPIPPSAFWHSAGDAARAQAILDAPPPTAPRANRSAIYAPSAAAPPAPLRLRPSEDGIRWLRPHRLLYDPGPMQFGTSVVDDGASFAPAAQRFKLAWYHGTGLRIAASPDGLGWTAISPGVLVPHTHDINGLFRDPLRGRYVATVSFVLPGPAWSGPRRVAAQCASTNLLDWSDPWLVLAPDDRQDEGATQFYAMDGFLARGDLVIGMVKVLRDDLKADDPPAPPDAYGIGDTTLAWTRDGERWVRDREPFFDRDPRPGAWDHAHAWIDEQLPVGDEVFLYYAGYRSGHKVNRFEERQIGLLRIGRDRYVARESAAGWLRTPPLLLEGSRLTLNADAARGEIALRLLDADGGPVAGFAPPEGLRITGDGVALPVRWGGTLRALAGKPVRLEFRLRGARIYAFTLEE